MSGLVFIVVPVYNRERLIGRCIDSIRRQSYSNWKLVVVDDSSTDETSFVVQSYTAIDSRISLVENTTQPSGAAGARNHGIECIDPQAEFVAFLDSDDEWYPSHLSKCVEALTAGVLADIVVEDLVRVTDSGDIVSRSKFRDESGLPDKRLTVRIDHGWLLKSGGGKSLARLINDRFTIGLHSSVFRRAVLHEQLLETYRVAEDFEFTIRLLKMGFSVVLLDSIGVRYYVHDENISSVGQQKHCDHRYYFNCVSEVRLLKKMMSSRMYDDSVEVEAIRRRIATLLFWGVAYNYYASKGELGNALTVIAVSRRFGKFSLAMIKTYSILCTRYAIYNIRKYLDRRAHHE